MKKIFILLALLQLNVGFSQEALKRKKTNTDSRVNVVLVEDGMNQADTMKSKKPRKSLYPMNVYLSDADMIIPDSFHQVKLKIAPPFSDYSPRYNRKWNYNRTLLACGIGFVGGVAYGYHEVLNYHYSKFKEVHPHANDQYWNPDISWLNKYRDYRLYGNEERFFLSTSLFAWATDASHPAAALSNLSLIGGTCVVTIGEKRKWWEYVIDIAAMSAARSLGFQLIYNGIYK